MFPTCLRYSAVAFAVAMFATNSSSADISFRRDLAPILVRRCQGCHSNRKTEGRYAVHTFASLLKPGESGNPSIVPGKPDESYLLEKLLETDEGLRMPQEDDALSATEIQLFRDWILQGAKLDGGERTDRLVTLLPPRVHPKSPERYRVPVPIFSLRFSQDGTQLYSSGVHELLVWDLEPLRLVKRISGLPQRIHALRLSPDGTTLAVGGGAPGEYGEVRLVDLKTGVVRTLAVWEDLVLTIAFSPDGNLLVAGGSDNSLRCYEVPSAKQLWRNKQHVDWVTSAEITDYRFIEERVSNTGVSKLVKLSGDDQRTKTHVRQHWQFPDESYIVREANWELRVEHGKPVALADITVTGIGKTYKVARQVFDEAALKMHAPVIQWLTSLHASWGVKQPGTNFVVTSSRDRTAKVFELASGKLFTTYKGHRREFGPLKGLHRLFTVQSQPGRRRVWTAGEGKHLHGWDPVTARDEDGTAADMEARFAKEYSVDYIRHDFSQAIFASVRQADHLFAVSAGGLLKQFAIRGPQAKYGVNAAQTLRTFTGHVDQLFAVDASHDGKWIAAGGYNGRITLWHPNKNEPAVHFSAVPQAFTQQRPPK